eukprot:CAMPEP_0172545892 /NCGR_PEP_ID=MMETSP1067-20121228/15743_1 /TAXON_ID=265564 ORGANISM="Thalassiosira punctigera, Strain Tpunct2005C2" /NCGR_SAMPLE_ID=MMETSP1067 /ASSEMBLY_ACC=CAM_ASM_000444 /LENGTH=287 /DNA_ID=CAMNT_0013332725 /DNA_START=12 /DNA_END=875 /DNA_ORIENTATION=+
MALRVARTASKFPQRSCKWKQHQHQHASFKCTIYVAQDLTAPASLLPPTTSRSPCFHHDHYLSFRLGAQLRSVSSSSGGSEENSTKCPDEEIDQSRDGQPVLLYEGPFASLTLKLKRISLASAAIGIVGLPALSLFYGSGSVPATGQLAIIATAGVTAVGSTALLGYCFSPYVHTMESLASEGVESETDGDDSTKAAGADGNLVRIVTRDILARRVETIFDPAADVLPVPNNNSRPFCNFVVMGKPMYVHPELIHHDKLRFQLMGEEPPRENAEARNKKKLDDDEFL